MRTRVWPIWGTFRLPGRAAKFLPAVFLPALLLSAGCAGPLRPTIQKSGDVWMRAEPPQAVGPGARVVVLPALSDPGNERKASIGLELLVEEIRNRRPGWTLIPAETILDPAAAGPAGPAEKDAREILDRSAGRQGISEEDARKLGALAGATHIVQLRLLFLKTEGEAEVSFLTTVFRAETGQKVWEGTGRGVGQHTIFGLFGPISIPVFFRSIAKEAVQAVAERLPD